MHTYRTIDATYAHQILDEIIALADRARPVSVAVVDASGNPVLQHRMSGATVATYHAAVYKAQTAMFFEKDTVEFGHERARISRQWRPKFGSEYIASAIRDLAGLANRRACFPNFVSWAGGVLILDLSEPGKYFGAVGVSGLKELEDDQLANDAIAAWLANSPTPA